MAVNFNSIFASLTAPNSFYEHEFEVFGTEEEWRRRILEVAANPPTEKPYSDWAVSLSPTCDYAESKRHGEMVYARVDRSVPGSVAWSITRHFPVGEERNPDLDTEWVHLRGVGNVTLEEVMTFASVLEI